MLPSVAVSVIALLPPDVANQIAAGEVVERPASVVKELVENSLDAGAETVTVTVDGGGLARLSVTNDGVGMHPDDLALSVVRHATSKIRAADDLVGVSTFGFRGEALPSIASVSRTRIVSRARGADAGAECVVEAGAPAVLKPAGCAVGTTITVEDLFYNTPARRKFMRTPATEGSACVEAVVRMAIPRPDVRFVVRRDGKVVREFLRHSDVASRVREVWPDEQLADLRGARGAVRVVALLGPPERARGGAGHLALYVNGRHVRDRLLMRAVAQAYGSTLDSGRYPVGAVLVEVPPEEVDVNVHPQKSEVRFQSQGSVFEAVMTVIRDAASSAPWTRAVTRPATFWSDHLAQGPRPEAAAPPAVDPVAAPAAAPVAAPGLSRAPAPAVSRPPPDDAPAPPPMRPLGAFVQREVAPADDPWGRILAAPYPPVAYADVMQRPSPASPVSAPVSAPDPVTESAPDGSTWAGLHYVGQVRRMYLVCEGPAGMVVLDQHAAAERVAFERLRRAYAARTVSMQPLLVPERVELSADEVAVVEEHGPALLALGVDLSPMGPTTVAVRAVPALLTRADPRRLVRDLVAELGRQSNDFSKAVDLVLATMACHGSLRGGEAIADDEARALLAALDTVDFSGHCPHGRPVLWSMRWSELERKVGR